MRLRQMMFNEKELIGKPITFNGDEVGIISGIKKCKVTCTLDNSDAASAIRDIMNTKILFSIEVKHEEIR